MITLITAVPGSGKTLHTVQMIDGFLQQRDADPDTPQEARPARLVYANIPLVLEKFPLPGNITMFPTPQVGSDEDIFDWRDAPSGSLVIYDEAQFFFPAKVKNKKTEEIITAMSTHRHQGYDIYIITQAPTLVNPTVRKLAGQHIHLYRAWGMQGATKYVWQHEVSDPNSRYEQTRAVKSVFSFPKQYYDWYVSSEQHTHKLQLPRKLIWLAAMMVLLLGLVGYMFWQDGGINFMQVKGMDTVKPEITTVGNAGAVLPAVTLPESELAYAWSSTPAAAVITGCVSNLSRGICQCYNGDGSTLALEQAQCLSVLQKPIPRNVRLSK